MTLTPKGLVVSMAKKIPQDVAFKLALKAKEAEKKAKEAEKKAKDAEKKIKEAEKKVKEAEKKAKEAAESLACLLYTSPSPRDS